MVFLVESGFRPADGRGGGRLAGRCAPFGASKKRYAHGGMAALSREEGLASAAERAVSPGKRLRTIETLKSKGMSNRAIAHQLGGPERTRSANWSDLPKPAEEAHRLALPAIPRRRRGA